jgi:hypothetical protein
VNPVLHWNQAVLEADRSYGATETRLTEVVRLPEHRDRFPEIKDPSIVRLGDSRFMMFASVGRTRGQSWGVGRFIAGHPAGPWQELAPVRFHDLAGPQLCAPAVTYEEHDGKPSWTMYIQTACFEENGVIALAMSDDGLNFHGRPEPLVTRNSVAESHPSLVGVYDAGVSEIRYQGRKLTCLLFSGCNRVGDADIYMSVRDSSDRDGRWAPARRVLRQDEVPFHNRPCYEHYEWGLEGANLVQLDESLYLMIGVCFLEKSREHAGTRQRVFFAASRNPFGGFLPIGTPLQPQRYNEGEGENGHPDAVVDGEKLCLVYQERAGEGQPWHLRDAAFDLKSLRGLATRMLKERDSAVGHGSFETADYVRAGEWPPANLGDLPGHLQPGAAVARRARGLKRRSRIPPGKDRAA